VIRRTRCEERERVSSLKTRERMSGLRGEKRERVKNENMGKSLP